MNGMKLDLRRTARELTTVILKDSSAYGGFPFYGIVILSALLVGAIAFATSLILSLIAITIVIMVVRLAYFKARPGKRPKKYKILYERIDNSSFPSIHTARSVMISIALLTQLNLLPILLLMILLVAASRIYFKRHYMIDILVGWAIGAILGYIFFLW